MKSKVQTEELFEYGIQTEKSDIRAHVSVVNRNVYVFKTIKGIEAVRRFEPPLTKAGQPGVEGPTAEGWLVKTDWIDDLRTLKFHSWEGWKDFRWDMSTSEKGAHAMKCVLACMKKGRFPFWINTPEDDRKNIQIKGVDILVFCRKKIQVKCDWRSGEKPNGTGNLFLQKAERNPLKNI